MKKHVGMVLGASLVSTMYASGAGAQTVVSQPAPPPQTVITTQPAPPQQTVVTQPTPAQTVVTPAPAPQQTVVAVPPARERATTTGPSPLLLTAGLLTFGVPYGISVVVAAESNRDSDKNLYIPVVGPWVAYSNEKCNGSDLACARTTGTKVLLAADGIFQAVGAVELVLAFVVPGTTTVASAKSNRRITMAPARVGSTGYGLAAIGSF